VLDGKSACLNRFGLHGNASLTFVSDAVARLRAALVADDAVFRQHMAQNAVYFAAVTCFGVHGPSNLLAHNFLRDVLTRRQA
jgi:hypothetical protein